MFCADANEGIRGSVVADAESWGNKPVDPYVRTDMGKALSEMDAADSAAVDRVRSAILDADEAERLAGVLAMFAEPVRIRILDALNVVGELCVGDLALALGVSEDAASYALRLLRMSGLVVNRRQGRQIRYRLADGFPHPLLEHCVRELAHLEAEDR